jgi:hypothetical protein
LHDGRALFDHVTRCHHARDDHCARLRHLHGYWYALSLITNRRVNASFVRAIERYHLWISAPYIRCISHQNTIADSQLWKHVSIIHSFTHLFRSHCYNIHVWGIIALCELITVHGVYQMVDCQQ